MNLNLIYTVVRWHHIKDRYIYWYEMPCKTYSVLVYEDDDDTVIAEFTRFFTNFTDALHYYNKTKKDLAEEKQ